MALKGPNTGAALLLQCFTGDELEALCAAETENHGILVLGLILKELRKLTEVLCSDDVLDVPSDVKRSREQVERIREQVEDLPRRLNKS